MYKNNIKIGTFESSNRENSDNSASFLLFLLMIALIFTHYLVFTFTFTLIKLTVETIKEKEHVSPSIIKKSHLAEKVCGNGDIKSKFNCKHIRIFYLLSVSNVEGQTGRPFSDILFELTAAGRVCNHEKLWNYNTRLK